jgi:UDP-GlcNAc3NAcA epimerase
MKIITIIGARPQFIKAAIVSRAINGVKDIQEVIVHTGQHFDENMSDIFFEEMGIPRPDYNLNINGLGHGAMTGKMLEKIEEVLLKEEPDWVLVYGDTNSTLAGALAAKKLHIKVAHVEAGLRSFNMKMPEEINRILTDRISDILFCPTDEAIKNLESEGYNNINCMVINVGDVTYDAALFYADIAKKPKVKLPENYILCTIHRAENTDNPISLKSIFDALEEIASETTIVMPLHPRTKNKLDALLYDFNSSKIQFIEPVGYLEMVYLLKNCELVMTDSGGLQKEAYFFAKHCLTLREETEWVELVENGFNLICGNNNKNIIRAYQNVKYNTNSNFDMGFYGNGHAGEKIVLQILKQFNILHF